MQPNAAELIPQHVDPIYVAEKVALFERTYDQQQIQWLIDQLGRPAQPESPITFEDIRQRYPHYLKLLIDDPTLVPVVDKYVDKLQPFLQCPFPLPGQRVIQGSWPGEYKIGNFTLCGVTAETIANKRVLDIGSNAGFDTFYLSTLGPCEIIGIEPTSLFYFQSLLLWSFYYCPNLRFVQTGWQTFTKEAFGTFDVINCQGVLYHERHPLKLLEALFDLLTPGGKLVLETHISLADDVTANFIEGAFWGDTSWWWVPTVKAVGAMLRSCGFRDVEVRNSYPVPSQNPDDSTHTVEGEPSGGRGFFTATRP
jgi:SAM-dependent methyltransferase